jgi:hypothetical protein
MAGRGTLLCVQGDDLVWVRAWLLSAVAVGLACAGPAAMTVPLAAPSPAERAVDLWYGTAQRFGARGNPQRWVNVLGTVRTPNNVVFSLGYRLNGGVLRPLAVGPDLHRLANPGDFNIEIDRSELREGSNDIEILALDAARRPFSRHVNIHYTRGRSWPLPYEIDWRNVRAISDVVEVVDGRWALVPNGVRTLDPWYDRVLALGDLTWTDYEISTVVTFHGFRPPQPGPPTYQVSHAALAVRWPGHDPDRHQPHRKWYPLGATAELQLSADLQTGRWRILKGPGDSNRFEEQDTRPIRLEIPYVMKAQVRSDASGIPYYGIKLWAVGAPEPPRWDLEVKGGPDDVPSGGALLVAHNTDVTFGRVMVRAVSGQRP